jgi:acyl-coenzyme A synthetase/AMP-(fatty) acid ligase
MSTLDFQPRAAQFYAEGHWREGDLWGDFAASPEARHDRVALRHGDREITYGELQRAAVGLSAVLGAQSIDPGDVVVFLGRNSIEAAVALLACLHRGVLAAPLPPMFGAAQLSALLVQAGAKALIGFGGEKEIAKCEALAGEVEFMLALLPETVDELAAQDADPARTSRAADDYALVLHTSGTTSAPKGMLHSNNTLRYAAENIAKRWELRADDTHLVVCEFGFVGSLVFGYLTALLSGATAVLMERWNAENGLRLLEEYDCAYTLFMPTHSADVLRSDARPSRRLTSLRSLVAPGLTRERREALREILGRPALGCYGMSEIPGHTGHRPDDPEEKLLVTEGRPFDGTEIRIVDEDGRSAVAGESGAVVVNGPSRFLGFLNNDELTRESLTDWGGYTTGDVGYLDEDGHLVYVGRSKDIIRRGGVTLVPAEIEPVIMRHPSIHEAAVVPIPDDRLGEIACAAVITKEGAVAPSLAELQAFLEVEGLSKYSWPESIVVFDDFPRTSSLKPVKRDIVKQIIERSSSGASV